MNIGIHFHAPEDENFNVFPERILIPQACEGRSPMIGGR